MKIPELVVQLSYEYNVFVACTEKAIFFLDKAEKYNSFWWEKFVALGGWKMVLIDEDEFSEWKTMGDSVLHIELRRWAGNMPLQFEHVGKTCFNLFRTFFE